jgi:hypothetical protein
MRDLKKLRSYYKRKVGHQLDLFNKEADKKFEAELAGKTPLEQLKIRSRKMAESNKLLKMREYNHHQINVSVDLDKVVYGFPEIRIWPKNPAATFKMPLTVNFRYIKNKKAILSEA